MVIFNLTGKALCLYENIGCDDLASGGLVRIPASVTNIDVRAYGQRDRTWNDTLSSFRLVGASTAC